MINLEKLQYGADASNTLFLYISATFTIIKSYAKIKLVKFY